MSFLSRVLPIQKGGLGRIRWTNNRAPVTGQGVLRLREFIGDYNGIAASNRAVYPVWTDGRNNAIERTGIGETDIFTNVELR